MYRQDGIIENFVGFTEPRDHVENPSFQRLSVPHGVSRETLSLEGCI